MSTNHAMGSSQGFASLISQILPVKNVHEKSDMGKKIFQSDDLTEFLSLIVFSPRIQCSPLITFTSDQSFSSL